MTARCSTRHSRSRARSRPAGGEVLLTDKYDQIFFRVLSAGGRDIAGDRELPGLPEFTPEENRLYCDAQICGKPVRVAALFTERDGNPITVLAAETLIKRNKLVWEILLGMLLPELGPVAATLLFVWAGSGLACVSSATSGSSWPGVRTATCGR